MASVAYGDLTLAPDVASADVSWIGGRPDWLDLDATRAVLNDVEISFDADAGVPARILHVGADSLGLARELRRNAPGAALVLDLCGDGEGRLGRRDARIAAKADLILLGSLAELQEFRRRHAGLADRTALFVRPVDLDTHAPLKQLHQVRDAQIKRFRRMHRLAAPMVLYAGPYTREGGLDLAIEAVFRLRERSPELRIAAIPHGAIDQDYLDQCERRILALGHHGIVEWNPEATDVPLWYAIAGVVCTPARSAVSSKAPKLAAAAGRPFVGSDVPGLAEHVVEGETGFLVSPDDVDTLTAALEALLGDEDEAARLGTSARQRAEEQLSPAAAARRLRRLWSEGADRGPQLAATRHDRSA